MKKNRIQLITYSGVMMALCLMGTYAIKIPISATGGYIHLGDAFVMLSGILLGPIYGAIAAGIGSALADLLAGYPQWALPTLIVKGIMAFIVGYAYQNRHKISVNLILTLSYISIWSVVILVARHFIVSEPAIQGESNAFFDMVQQAGLTTDSRLVIIMATMLLPLALVLIYKVVSLIRHQSSTLTTNIAYIVAGSIMVILYYITTVILYGNLMLPVIDIPMNILQFIIGIILVNALTPMVKHLEKANQPSQT